VRAEPGSIVELARFETVERRRDTRAVVLPPLVGRFLEVLAFPLAERSSGFLTVRRVDLRLTPLATPQW
jgi:hypothetical protein